MRWHRLWSCICSPMRVVSVAGKRAPFLLLPGAAPTERGRAAARRTLSKQPARSLPDLPSEAEQWLPNFGSAVATRGVTTCWRDSWGWEAARSLVSDSSATPRSGAGGRRRGRQAGLKAGSAGRSGADGSQGGHIFGVCAGKEEGTVSAAKPNQEGVAETWVYAGMGS